MKIYVINLARAPDRHKKMFGQANTLGLNFQFIEARDGRFLTDDERSLVDLQQRKRISRYNLSDNEIACWISHRQAMQMLVDSGDAMATILEDDVKILPDFSEILAVLAEKETKFDFIDLHRCFKNGEIFRPCAPLLGDIDIGRIGLAHILACSYVISRKGAKKFLANSSRFAHAVDAEIHHYWTNDLDIYGLSRPVVQSEDDGFSYIDETRKHDRPNERIPLNGADSLPVILGRKLYRIGNSIGKRLAFPIYVRRGRKIWRK